MLHVEFANHKRPAFGCLDALYLTVLQCSSLTLTCLALERNELSVVATNDIRDTCTTEAAVVLGRLHEMFVDINADQAPPKEMMN